MAKGKKVGSRTARSKLKKEKNIIKSETESGGSGGKFTSTENQAAWWQPAVMIFTRLSGWIVAPVILAVVAGKWLDKKYGTEPWLFLIVVALAFVVSMIGLIRQAMEEFKKIEQTDKEITKDKKIKN